MKQTIEEVKEQNKLTEPQHNVQKKEIKQE
jgi:hypothetical protein